MHTTLAAICGLQQKYSSSNTPEMQERGRLVKHRRQLEAIKPAKAPGQNSIGANTRSPKIEILIRNLISSFQVFE